MQFKSEKEVLHKKGIAVTAIRLLVLSVFLEYKKAFSLKTLEEELVFSDRSSLFRTLRLFEKKGVLHPILSFDGVKNYAVCKENCQEEMHLDEHAHFKCNYCFQIFCTPIDLSFLSNLEIPYKVDTLQLFINGTCEECNQIAT